MWNSSCANALHIMMPIAPSTSIIQFWFQLSDSVSLVLFVHFQVYWLMAVTGLFKGLFLSITLVVGSPANMF